ncbi:MAG: FAD-dependent oxidoreductase [Ectothiorhodospiraceae bacterium]|nr:FAD-dependent oxidoreductase [Chromatiales bacterium]MCP5155688.1 FAD-dependent oxidoreductase [Ectothiorhodospiraceae bacterium]
MHVVVVGAGIIGACSAVRLVERGHRVTVVDRLPPGEACSFGNAGALIPSACVPDSMPGMLSRVPGWLLRDDGPLTIRWRYLPRLVPWLVQFVRAGHPDRIGPTADALHALHASTVEEYQALVDAAGTPELVRASDVYVVYGSDASYRGSLTGWRLREAHGARTDHIDGATLREAIPALSPRYVRAVRMRDQAYTVDPSRLVKALTELAVRLGATLHPGEVGGMEHRDGRVTAVRVNGDRLEADAVVIAAGAWSASLARQIGVDVPLGTKRGYHVTAPSPGFDLPCPVSEAECGFYATPMSMGVRFAGTVELSGLEAPPEPARSRNIERMAKRMFPALDTTGATRWMGCRPAMPDGLPVIGRSPTVSNAFVAFGHGHCGMIGGPTTGRMVASLVHGDTPNVDVRPYAPTRFRAR